MANGRKTDIQRMTEAGVDMIFKKTAKMPRKKLYPMICTEVKQPKEIGIYDSMGDITAASIKPEGDAVSFDALEQAYQTTITSKTVAKGVEATLEKLEYDLYGVVNKTFGVPLQRVMQIYKEIEIADHYNHGFATTGADGQFIFDTDHPLVNSTLENSNLATGALTPDNLIAAKNMFIDIKDQAGMPFDTYPTTLLINDKKQYVAMQILESQLVAFELSNTKNVVNALQPIRIVANRYIDYNTSTDVSPWFLIDDSLEDAGCILQTKKGIMLETEWLLANQIYRGICLEMYGSGVVAPGYKIVGSTGA
jgi:phage major head subunit gpT-like protein